MCVCDWNGYKRIHGNIHSTPIHQPVVSFYNDSPALEKKKKKEHKRKSPHCIIPVHLCLLHPLSWLLQFEVCSGDVVLINRGLNEVGPEEIINWPGRK